MIPMLSGLFFLNNTVMTDYIELRINLTPCSSDATDLLASDLAEIGYESFVPDAEGMTAYIARSLYNEAKVKEILDNMLIPAAAEWKATFVKGEDWNALWEQKYFKPIVIEGRCVVCSSFHKDVPQADYKIIVDPKMAFGTGHHATTSLMLSYLLDTDLTGRRLIDVGTGTGILAMLGLMRGASEAVGIEIDPDAADNARDNAALNGVAPVILTGDASRLADAGMASVVVANINRNVILADIDSYAEHLEPGGTLLLSGFYEADIPLVESAMNRAGITLEETRMRDSWVALRGRKSDLKNQRT